MPVSSVSAVTQSSRTNGSSRTISAKARPTSTALACREAAAVSRSGSAANPTMPEAYHEPAARGSVREAGQVGEGAPHQVARQRHLVAVVLQRVRALDGSLGSAGQQL